MFVSDLSDGSNDVFEYAVYFAGELNASIVMLYVMDDSPRAVGVTQGGPMLKFLSDTEEYQKILKEQEENARGVLLGQQAELNVIRSEMKKISEDRHSSASDVKVDDIIVKQGRVAEQIIIAAKDKNCDLIIMGRSADNFLEHALLGKRTAQRVTKWADIPVLLVPMKSE